MSKKMVYFFGNGKAESNATMKTVVGGKGANLAEMTNLGIPVPPGFTITTETCAAYDRSGGKWPSGLKKQVCFQRMTLWENQGEPISMQRLFLRLAG